MSLLPVLSLSLGVSLLSKSALAADCEVISPVTVNLVPCSDLRIPKDVALEGYTNEDTISALDGDENAVIIYGQINTFRNNGSISDPDSFVTALRNYGNIDQFDNYGTIETSSALFTTGFGNSSSPQGLTPNAQIGTLNNYGLIRGAKTGLSNSGGTIEKLHNYANGRIEGGLGNAIRNNTNRRIGEIVNFGIIDGCADRSIDCDFDAVDIYNAGIIEVLHNAQGGANPLTVGNYRPQNYAMIVRSDGSYGQVAFSNPYNNSNLGSTIFDISDYSTGFIYRDFDSVMAGIGADNIGNDDLVVTKLIQGESGKPDKIFTWQLVEDEEGVWDLTWLDNPDPDPDPTVDPTDPIPDPDVIEELISQGLIGQDFDLEGTQATIVSTANSALGFLDVQSAIATETLSYDCNRFSSARLCLSGGGRYTSIDEDGASEFAGFVTAAVQPLAYIPALAAFEPFTRLRIGGFIDQRLSGDDWNMDGFEYEPSTPRYGAFAGFGHEDGRGVQIRVSTSYQSGDMNITRTKLQYTEAGEGDADFESWAVGGEVGYGVLLSDRWMATPFAAYREVESKRGAYEEKYIEDVVDLPISYNDFALKASTVSMGMKLAGELSDAVKLTAALAVEHDFAMEADFSGSSEIDGIEEFSFDAAQEENNTRMFGAAGVEYGMTEDHVLRLGVSARQLTFGDDVNITTTASFTAGF